MLNKQFIKRYIQQIQQGGLPLLLQNIRIAVPNILMLPFYPAAILTFLVIRLIKPWLLIRIGYLYGSRIGHLAANTELYLCERDAGINVPKQRYVDVFFMTKPICNHQLFTMWKRILFIGPVWIFWPVHALNNLFLGGVAHRIGDNTQNDRDTHNLLDRFPPHLKFTADEVSRGEAGLRAIGIPAGSPFICLSVRDSGYLSLHYPLGDWRYHNFRDSNIQNFVLAAEELADRGYYVIRMGAKVNKAMKTTHPKVIDYAVNGMRSDFMDIYLGAKCEFLISSGAGWDAVPTWLFRKQAVFVNLVPLGYTVSYSDRFLSTTKRHILSEKNHELTLSEIFTTGVGFCMSTSDYESKGIRLIENTPEEIRDIVIEMAERLNGTWQPHEEDELLQKRFWEIFPTDAISDFNGRPLHGEIRARFGADFLRNNKNWLQ